MDLAISCRPGRAEPVQSAAVTSNRCAVLSDSDDSSYYKLF